MKIHFGHIDWFGGPDSNGSKDNDVIAKVEFKDGRFSASIYVWKPFHKDVLCGGQAFDHVYPFFKTNARFLELYEYWKRYHLNDMHAGTAEQEAYLSKFNKDEWRDKYDYYYSWACDKLKEVNLYEVEYEGKPYKFGTKWLFREIPEEVAKKIQKFLYDFGE